MYIVTIYMITLEMKERKEGRQTDTCTCTYKVCTVESVIYKYM